MATLFDTDNKSAGFHLDYLELYNWGTFHDKVWRLSPGCRNSLLTGANGSGKTTVADALITLLVPPGRRHYNQSSGADKKKERDELTYFMGAYGNIRQEDSSMGTTQNLRGKDDVSIILASFQNQSYHQKVTLAQIRWFSGGLFKRLYLVSNSALEIERDLTPYDSGSQWKKELLSRHPVKFFDSFQLYSQAFSALFGFRSDKALALFSQTVGVKVLGDLNEFIRENMLEAQDMEEDFGKLRKNYDDLLGAHRQIEKAREQLKLLSQVSEKGKTYEILRQKKEASDLVYDSIPPVFAYQSLQLLKTASETEETSLITAENKRFDLDNELEGLRRRERDMEFSIRGQSTQDLAQSLRAEMDHLEELQQGKRQLAEEYSVLALALGFPALGEENEFWMVHEEASRQIRDVKEQLPLTQNHWSDLRQTLKGQDETLTRMEEDILFLRETGSSIPAALVAERDALAEFLGLEASKLPFAGELMQVKDESYRRVFEAFLAPVSLGILVPSDKTAPALGWLTGRNSPQRLHLLISQSDELEGFFDRPERDLLLEKLEFRPQHEGSLFLRNYLKSHFDYLCQDTLQGTQVSPRSLFVGGLIKQDKHWTWLSSPERTEDLFWYLGWDQGTRIQELQGQLKVKRAQRDQWSQKLLEVQNQLEGLQTRLIQLEKLLTFQNYAEVSWQKDKKAQEELAAQWNLLSAEQGLEGLQNQLADLKLKIKDRTREKEDYIALISRMKKNLEEYEKETKDHSRVLQDYGQMDLDQARSRMEPYLSKINRLLDLENINGIHDEVTKYVGAEKKSLGDELKGWEKSLEQDMHRFLNPGQELLTKFPEWSGETANLMANKDYLADFVKIFEKIQGEDLPGYQKRFKEWLNQRLLEDMADFKASLENHQKGVLESIKELNQALRSITYNALPPTYIELHTEDSKDSQIRDFRRMLRESMPKTGEEDLETSFHRIRNLIQSLSEQEEWRKKVTDVRNWLQFAAVERHREDGSQKQYYQDSQSLSGGEKAKLAYTILASAIAYQFGIRRDAVTSRSFRFAVVDEAFSKVDPENSRFAMNLFEQLDLQLMVVTPLDKINVVEDHISSIHYVEKKGPQSSVFDLSLETYQKLSQELIT